MGVPRRLSSCRTLTWYPLGSGSAPHGPPGGLCARPVASLPPRHQAPRGLGHHAAAAGAGRRGRGRARTGAPRLRAPAGQHHALLPLHPAGNTQVTHSGPAAERLGASTTGNPRHCAPSATARCSTLANLRKPGSCRTELGLAGGSMQYVHARHVLWYRIMQHGTTIGSGCTRVQAYHARP